MILLGTRQNSTQPNCLSLKIGYFMHHVFGTECIKLVHYPTWESPPPSKSLRGVGHSPVPGTKGVHISDVQSRSSIENSVGLLPHKTQGACLPRTDPFPHIFYSSSSLKYPDNSQVKWKSLSCVQLFATAWTNTVHEILQAKILEWVAFPFSRDLPNSRIKPWSPALQVVSFPAEPQVKPRW